MFLLLLQLDQDPGNQIVLELPAFGNLLSTELQGTVLNILGGKYISMKFIKPIPK